MNVLACSFTQPRDVRPLDDAFVSQWWQAMQGPPLVLKGSAKVRMQHAGRRQIFDAVFMIDARANVIRIDITNDFGFVFAQLTYRDAVLKVYDPQSDKFYTNHPMLDILQAMPLHWLSFLWLNHIPVGASKQDVQCSSDTCHIRLNYVEPLQAINVELRPDRHDQPYMHLWQSHDAQGNIVKVEYQPSKKADIPPHFELTLHSVQGGDSQLNWRYNGVSKGSVSP